MSPLRMVFSLIALAVVSLSARAAESELHARAGLPNVAARVAANTGELRVAYFGGSITAAENGWRSLTTAHLRAKFPGVIITEIMAGLPGTGSDLGACRLEQDVLRHRPDLVFVEFAVNDSATPPARIERTMEGIVRQIRRANPRTDIWFVYTLSAPGLDDLQAGRFQASALAMENVAARYGIPSLHFGLEVARRVTDGSLVFKAPEASAFSHDGVHPTAIGHEIYFTTLARSLPALLTTRAAGAQGLPVPLHADNWEGATQRLLEDVTREGEWTRVPLEDANLRGSTKSLLSSVWRAAQPGAAIEFEFRGTRFGLLGIAAPDSGQFRVTVDDLPPVTDTMFDSYVSTTFCRQRGWFFPAELTDGVHRVRVELLDAAVDKAAIKTKAGKTLEAPAAYADNRLTLAGVLIVGSSDH